MLRGNHGKSCLDIIKKLLYVIKILPVYRIGQAFTSHSPLETCARNISCRTAKIEYGSEL